MMEVKVKFLSDLKRLAGTEACSLTVRENITLREFLTIVDKMYLKNKLLDKVGRKVSPRSYWLTETKAT